MKQAMIHPDDVQILADCTRLAQLVANQFNMPLKCVEHKRRPTRDGALGLCYVAEGRISIMIRWRDEDDSGNKVWGWRTPLPEIFRTVIHEVAHLTDLPDGPEHRELQRKMQEWVKVNHPEFAVAQMEK